MSRTIAIILAGLSLLGVAAPGGLTAARADSVFVRASGDKGSALEIPDVKILRIEDGMLLFDNSGNETGRTLAQVQQISVEGEDALNAAEQSYVSGDYASAVDGYLKTFRSPSKPWLKDWAVVRLMDSANRANRFDAAADAYIYLLEQNANAAPTHKPTFPDAASEYLTTAAGDVQSAIDETGHTDAQKAALLGFLIDIDNAKNDKAAADKAGEQLDELLASDPSNPGAQRVLARRRLVAAGAALSAGDWAQAQSIIEKSRAQITDPQQQAEALWVLAEARYGQLGSSTDPDALKDAALAYMRVVADFKDLDGHPHVVESLLKTAQIEEKLNNAGAARELYQQIVQQYPDDAQTDAAKQRLAQLKQ